MGLQERFIQYLHEQALCQPRDRILLAVSGGKDSVLMAHLFAWAGYTIAIAHCNFRLRGDESDADEALVYQLAKRLAVPFYSTGFDTGDYARQHGVSIQMAARELRYEWFETLRVSQGYDYIATAHHQSDHVETLLLNLVRGTGLAGLRGIQPKRDHIIRPLLFLSATAVQAFVAERRLEYRDDASNFSTKYARNKIRLEVIPTLKELNPELEQTITANIARFDDAHAVLQDHVDALRHRLFKQCGMEEWEISIDALIKLRPRRFLLYELFKHYGFSEAVVQDLERALQGMPGKQFVSRSYILFLDRKKIVLRPKGSNNYPTITITAAGQTLVWGNYRFISGYTAETVINDNVSVAQFDADKIIFPLLIRSWQEGDTFHPLGMWGRKKLSDFFVSLKIPVYRKPTIPIVVNGNGDIIWVAPYRMDDRYKITAETKKVFTLACF